MQNLCQVPNGAEPFNIEILDFGQIAINNLTNILQSKTPFKKEFLQKE
jgi:hypothetical protein